MSKVEALAEKVIQLPVEDRAYLAECLLASLDERGANESWIEQAKRRREEVVSGKVRPVPAETVYQRIDDLLQR